MLQEKAIKEEYMHEMRDALSEKWGSVKVHTDIEVFWKKKNDKDVCEGA